MKYLKLFESFGFSREINPDILTREQFESLSRQSIHMRFSSKTTIGLTMNVRKTDININYDSKVKQHIMFYFKYSYLDAKMVFNTKFSIMKTEGDEPFVYFQSGYGYRNVGTDFTNYQNYPQDQTIYGRIEMEEFDMIIKNPRLWKDWMVDKTFELDQQTHKILKESFGQIPEPELMDDNEWDDEVNNAEEVDFNQKEKELFISLSDTILVKHKIDLDALEIGDSQLSFSMVNGEDGIYPNLRSTTVIRSITSYKNDDEYYYVNVWEGNDSDGGTKSYRCDGYECWEKFLKEIFAGYRDLINNQSKTNESMFDEIPEPKSLLDEDGDYIGGSSRLRMNNREPFNQKEKSFINQLLETLNEDYISTNFSDSSEFVLNMGEMGETTHGMRVVKMEDDYYEVQYNNFVDSDDEYIYCECDGFKCLSKLLIELFGKIKTDYDHEG
jgi:hypothetical protein